ncbi:phosphatase PAP2 family protein [Sulfuricurvum sp.]|uniref:phosphatase PAP2 family protein n=2 Tax=Sulfuricurvum sp. TaxID=2025608 RepID=UPI002617C3B6|nr:phosphatase PAP2 family protein [Sulfuricurvum sp.]MDD3597464.1 phosphatase PAP2 family protein [Sulfuricurvum sp.]
MKTTLIIERELVISLSLFLCFSAFLSYLYLDKSLALYCHQIHSLWVKKLFFLLTQIGDSKYTLIPLAIFYLIYRKFNTLIARKLLYLFSVVAFSGILVDIIKVIVARMRPKMLFLYDQYEFVWFKTGSSFNSFPSGHSATAFSFFVALSLLYPKYRYLFFALAALVVSSRVVLSAHYLSDVLIGSLIGGLSALWIHRKMNPLWRYLKTKY